MSGADLSTHTINGISIQKVLDHSSSRIAWRKNQQIAFCAFLARHKKSHATLEDNEEQLLQLCREADALDGPCRDPAALPPHFWQAIRKRILSSLTYTLNRLKKEGKIRETYDAVQKQDVIHWPAALVDEWTRAGGGWTGNEREGTQALRGNVQAATPGLQAQQDIGSGFEQLPVDMDWEPGQVPNVEAQPAPLRQQSSHYTSAAAAASSSSQQPHQQQRRPAVNDPNTHLQSDDRIRELEKEVQELQIEKQQATAMAQSTRQRSRRLASDRQQSSNNCASEQHDDGGMHTSPAYGTGEHRQHQPRTSDIAQPEPSPYCPGPSQIHLPQPDPSQPGPSYAGPHPQPKPYPRRPGSAKIVPSHIGPSRSGDGISCNLSQSCHAPPQCHDGHRPISTPTVPLKREPISNQRPFQQSGWQVKNSGRNNHPAGRSAMSNQGPQNQHQWQAPNPSLLARETRHNSSTPQRPFAHPPAPQASSQTMRPDPPLDTPKITGAWSSSPLDLPLGSSNSRQQLSSEANISRVLHPSSSMWSNPSMLKSSFSETTWHHGSSSSAPRSHPVGGDSKPRTSPAAGVGRSPVPVPSTSSPGMPSRTQVQQDYRRQGREEPTRSEHSNVDADANTAAITAAVDRLIGNAHDEIDLVLQLVDRAADLGMRRLRHRHQQLQEQHPQQLPQAHDDGFNKDDRFEAGTARTWSPTWERILRRRATGGFI